MQEGWAGPYGFQLEPTTVEGIRTKMMVPDSAAADHVRLMFEMYAEPGTSFGDISRYFEENDIKVYGKSLFRPFLSQLLRNPVYAQADLELYEFFKSQGAAVVNDAAGFAGTNDCYLYQGRDVKEDKDRSLKDQILVIAPHEEIVSSDTWLKYRKKLMANTTFQNGSPLYTDVSIHNRNILSWNYNIKKYKIWKNPAVEGIYSMVHPMLLALRR